MEAGRFFYAPDYSFPFIWTAGDVVKCQYNLVPQILPYVTIRPYPILSFVPQSPTLRIAPNQPQIDTFR